VVVIQMATSFVVLFLAAVAFLLLEVSSFKRTEFRELRTLGFLLANNAAPNLAFEDPDAAARILDGLKVRPSIVLARIHRAKGDLLAQYPPAAPGDAPSLPLAQVAEGITAGNDHLRLVQLIRDREGTPIGSLVLEEDMQELHRQFRSSGAALAVVFLFLGIGALLASLKIQGMITRPILDLAHVADRVSRTQDYSLRAAKWAEDELGHLADTFNTMLSRIQEQDALLTEHRENLESLVERRTAQLTRLNEELLAAKAQAEESNQAKSAFLSGMSHELRTPLNAILGYTQLMALEPERDAKDRRQLEMVLRAGEHLLGLINDVLSVSRIEARRQSLNPAPFDLRRFILGVEDMIRLRAKAKFLTFNIDVDERIHPVVLGDEGKLRQVLVNLLGNAVKFTQEGGIALRVTATGEDHVLFEVRDSGAGIPEADLPNLFNAFFQTGLGRNAKEGAGLGLYLSQALVRLMGGEIHVDSRTDQGSCFSFTLPLPPGGEEPLENRPQFRIPKLVPGQPAPRQLVVDDNPDNRNLMAALFETLGLPCRVAADGLAGLQMCKDWNPDIIWMDIRMPGMDGFEATRTLRAEEAASGAARRPILAVTASVFEHDRQAIFECGCDDLLLKPFRIQELLTLLTRHAGLRFEEDPGSPVEPEKAQPESLRDALASMPLPWLEAFREALDSGETDKALAMAGRLADDQARLAQGLRAYLEEFRLDELERILQWAMEGP
jgi:signal transduction histidine kinase/CheY-like chemotaxis protein